MSDHYEVLGVEPDADRETIREARQSKISEIDERLRNPKAKNKDELRRSKGDINRAWAVLADPYQRERYDAELGGSLAAEGDGPSDEDDASTDDTTPQRHPVPEKSPEEMTLRERWKAGMQSAPRGANEIPGDYEPAPVMRRLGAAVMDVIVVAAYFVALGSLAIQVADDDNMIPAPFVWGSLVLSLAVLILYTVVPVVRTGRTLGHRLLGLAVVSVEDGERLSWRNGLRRYAVVILLTAIAPLAPGNVFQMAALLVGLSFLFSQKGVSLLDRFGRSRVVVAPG